MPVPPLPSAEPSRRRSIVHAAAELFAEQGFHAVGMRAIADAVGIRGSSLYHHFASKLDLLHAIALEATETFVASQRPALEAGGPPRERLERLMRDHVVYFHGHRREEAVGVRDLHVLRQQAPELYEDVLRERRGYQRAVQDLIEEGVAAGELHTDDPGLATLALLGLVNSISGWFRDDGPRTIQDVAAVFAELGVGRLLGGNDAAAD